MFLVFVLLGLTCQTVFGHGEASSYQHTKLYNLDKNGGYLNNGYSQWNSGIENIGQSVGQIGNNGFNGYSDQHSHTQPKYVYKYGVNDPHTGDNKDAWEVRDGDSVKGGYSLKEADGTIRVVEYTADNHNGFKAIVKNIGKPIQPQVHTNNLGTRAHNFEWNNNGVQNNRGLRSNGHDLAILNRNGFGQSETQRPAYNIGLQRATYNIGAPTNNYDSRRNGIVGTQHIINNGWKINHGRQY